MGKYEGFIQFLCLRKELGGKLVLVREPGRLYAKEELQNGMVFRWYYHRDAPADYIARQAGIPLIDFRKESKNGKGMEGDG
jgi:hypothetical protein